MTSEDVQEVVSESIAAGTKCVDGVVKNVKILGKHSKNKGGVYPVEVMREAAHLYDGAKVNIDHTRENNPTASFHDRFGVIRNPRVVGEELRGDLHFNPKHHSAEQFAWAVENQPESIGFSHLAAVDWKPVKGGRIAVKIKRVKSVDIVADPATTSGVFEDVDPEEKPDDELPLTGRARALSELSDDQFAFIEPGGKRDASGRTSPRSKRLWPLNNADAVRAAFNSIPRMTRLSEDDRKVALARTGRAAAKLKIKPPGVPVAQSNEGVMADISGLTMEDLRAQRPDLADALIRESSKTNEFEALTKEHEALKKKLSALEAEAAKVKLAGEINEAIAECGLDPQNPKHVGKALRRVLESVSDEKERLELIRERHEELETAGLLEAEGDVEGESEQEPPPTKEHREKPVARYSGAAAGGGTYHHADSKAFMKSLRRRF